MTDDIGQLVEAVPLEEHATVVAELLRSDLVAVWDLEFADLHLGSLPSRLDPVAGRRGRRTRRPSGDDQRPDQSAPVFNSVRGMPRDAMRS
jgi:hypothetical protein